MSKWKLAASTAAIALLAGQSALADVTPEQVWEEWQTLITAYGQTLETAGADRAGDTLVVTGLKINAVQEDASATVTVDEIRFQDRGDGSVRVTMSETVPVAMVATGVDGEAKDVDMTMEITQPGLEVIASGAPGDMRYDFTAPQMNLRLTGTEDGAAAPAMTMDFGLGGVSGNYQVTGTDTKTLASTFKGDSITMAMNVDDPEGDGTMVFNGSAVNLTGTSNAVLPSNYDTSNPAAALAAGMAVDGGFSYGAGQFDFDFAGDGQTMKGTGSFEGGDFNVLLNQAQMGYGALAKATTMTFTSSELPFPEIQVSYAEGGFNFLMPVSKSDEAADFALMTKITDLTFSDAIWGMFDPMGQLPRDPLSVVLDTKGTARLTADILDPAQAEAMESAAPGELHSLELTQLLVKGIGAEIAGDGALTFDNTDLETYGGIPAPTGVINLKAVGINGVMDKLVAMGMLPEDQVMGVRMMMGMFAKAVEGEADAMTSTLEFKGKSFFANGMQLQ